MIVRLAVRLLGGPAAHGCPTGLLPGLRGLAPDACAGFAHALAHPVAPARMAASIRVCARGVEVRVLSTL